MLLNFVQLEPPDVQRQFFADSAPCLTERHEGQGIPAEWVAIFWLPNGSPLSTIVRTYPLCGECKTLMDSVADERKREVIEAIRTAILASYAFGSVHWDLGTLVSLTRENAPAGSDWTDAEIENEAQAMVDEGILTRGEDGQWIKP